MRRGTFGTVAASAAVAAIALAGCGGPDGGGGDDATITWMAHLHTPHTPADDGPVQTALEKHTGQDFEMQWVPAASKAEKINAALASGDLADIVSLTETESTSVRSALKSGAFWDVEPFLADYPNLSKIDPDIVDAARIDGTVYGVPLQQYRARYGVLVRQDWLDNLGLEVPHTIDDLTKVAHAFTHDDPDGDGKDDTTGFIDRAESFHFGFNTLAGFFGSGNVFDVDASGTLTPAFASDEFKQAMEWYRGVYEDGAVNQEFVTVQKSNQQDAIAQGKGGIVVTGLFEAKNYAAIAQSADPETPMDWALVNDMTFDGQPHRIISDTGGGMGGWLAIPRSEVPDEAELKKVLAFIDKLLDPEAYALMTNGVEGTHYSVDDDEVVTITDQTAWEQEVQPYSSSRPSENAFPYKTATPFVDEADEKMTEQAPDAVVNPAQTLTSETFDRQWSTLEKQVNDAYNRYVTGQIEMSDYEAVIDELGGQGLDKISEELTAAHQAANG